MTTQLVSVIIRENVIAFQQTSEETGFFPSLAHYVMGILISIFIVLVNIVHITNDDFGSVFVDSFLIIPVLGSSLYTLAVKTEPKLQNLVLERQKLIDLMRTEYKDEEAAIFLDTFLPDLADAQKLSKSLPGPFEINPMQIRENLYKARDILMRILQNPDNSQKLKEKLSEYARTLQPQYKVPGNIETLQQLGSKYPEKPVQEFTGGKRSIRKWTLRKSKV